MCLIKEICNIFYDSTHIPIMVTDNAFNSIYELGHTDNTKKTLSPIYGENKLCLINPTCNCISLNEDNSMIATYIRKQPRETEDYYFIIGPIKIAATLTLNEAPCRTKKCINYLTQFLSLIYANIMENFNKNYSPCVKQALEIVHKDFAKNLNVQQICAEINISKSYFCNIFKKETGHSFITYLNLYRIENSKKLLRNSTSSILDIALSIGYQSQSYFCRSFKKHVGVSPLEYRTIKES